VGPAIIYLFPPESASQIPAVAPLHLAQGDRPCHKHRPSIKQCIASCGAGDPHRHSMIQKLIMEGDDKNI